MLHTRADYREALVTGGFSLLTIMDIPIRDVPEGYLPEAMFRTYSDALFCLIIHAQKDAREEESDQHH